MKIRHLDEKGVPTGVDVFAPELDKKTGTLLIRSRKLDPHRYYTVMLATHSGGRRLAHVKGGYLTGVWS